MADFFIGQGDRLPPIAAALLAADGLPVDLTGATVAFLFRRQLGGTTVVAAASIVAPSTSGRVQYDWAPDDTLTPGTYDAQWRVTFPGGKQATYPNRNYTTIEVNRALDG